MEEYKIEESGDITDQDLVAGKSPSVGSFIWDLLKVVIVAFGIMLLFRFFIAEPFIVSGVSMQPNFYNHEYLVVNKIDYHLHAPQRGDVVVFKYPKDPSQYFIKRIIGLPGEKVRITDGHAYIYDSAHPQGYVLNEQYLPNQDITYGNAEITTLGSDEYYVLGDNRAQSSDSRVWGILPKNDIVGKVSLRIFPLNQLGFVPSVSY